MRSNSYKLDAHFHLDLYENYQQILSDIVNQNIYLLAVTNTPSVFHFTKNISLNYPNVLPAIGLHPELVDERMGELELLLKSICNERFVGEVGLDYSNKYSLDDRNLQRKVFEKILNKCAEVGNRFISIHSRRAASDVIDMVGNNFPGTIILHWFSGSIHDLNKAIEYGLYFSVNPAMTKSKAGQKIIARIPQNRILIETDGPFIEIDKYNLVKPHHIQLVINYFSKIWDMGFDETNSIIMNNNSAAGFFIPE